MNRCRYIASLLLAVYLFVTAAPAVASLTCHCTMRHTASVHCLCAGCTHDDGTGATHWTLPECTRHSNAVRLYTAPADDRSAVRCPVLDLSADRAALCPCPAHCPVMRHLAPLADDPLPDDRPPIVGGFRAPPVMA